jgi:hypothetical protein
VLGRDESVVEDNTGLLVSMVADSTGGEEGREMMKMRRRILMSMIVNSSLKTRRKILTSAYSSTMKLSWSRKTSPALSSLRRRTEGVRSLCLCGEAMGRGRDATTASYVRKSGSLFAHQALWSLSAMCVLPCALTDP